MESRHGRPPYDREEAPAPAPAEPLLYDEFLQELAACSAPTLAAAGTARTQPREEAAAADRRRAREEAEEALARQEAILTDMHGYGSQQMDQPLTLTLCRCHHACHQSNIVGLGFHIRHLRMHLG